MWIKFGKSMLYAWKAICNLLTRRKTLFFHACTRRKTKQQQKNIAYPKALQWRTQEFFKGGVESPTFVQVKLLYHIPNTPKQEKLN